MRSLVWNFMLLWLSGNVGYVAASLYPSSPKNMNEKLTCDANSHYFAIDIPHFTIYPSEKEKAKIVRIQLHVNHVKFPAFYDRPIRKIFQTTIEEVLGYLYCSNKRDLTLTLMLSSPLERKSLPLAFRVQESTYHADLRKIEFIAELIESPALEFLEQTSLPFQGASSSLLIDG